MKKMKRDFKERWVKALRNEEYPRSGTRLIDRHGNGDLAYCALGVACELSPALKSVGSAGFLPAHADVSHYVPVNGYLSEVMADILGIDRMLAVTIANMNDCGEPWEKIAQYICDNVPEED